MLRTSRATREFCRTEFSKISEHLDASVIDLLRSELHSGWRVFLFIFNSQMPDCFLLLGLVMVQHWRVAPVKTNKIVNKERRLILLDRSGVLALVGRSCFTRSKGLSTRLSSNMSVGFERERSLFIKRYYQIINKSIKWAALASPPGSRSLATLRKIIRNTAKCFNPTLEKETSECLVFAEAFHERQSDRVKWCSTALRNPIFLDISEFFHVFFRFFGNFSGVLQGIITILSGDEPNQAFD